MVTPMSTELDTYLALNKDLKLANNRAAQREAESARLNAELSLSPATGNARSDETAMPDGGTSDQRSRWKRYSYDREGSIPDAGHGVNQA